MNAFSLKKIRFILGLSFLASIWSVTLARQPRPKPLAFHVFAQKGGFRMIEGDGPFEIELSGTLLVSGLKGTIRSTPHLKLQYEKYNRKVYSGSGIIHLVGQFKALQWQGGRFKMNWNGTGKGYATGEYDPKGKQGVYWTGDSKKRTPLPTNPLNPIDLSQHEIK